MRLAASSLLLMLASIGAAACAGCGHTAVPAAQPSGATTDSATEGYLGSLVAGDHTAIAAAFAESPTIDDPFAGAVRGTSSARRLRQRPSRLAHGARRRGSSPGPITRAAGRTVVEATLRLRPRGARRRAPDRRRRRRRDRGTRARLARLSQLLAARRHSTASVRRCCRAIRRRSRRRRGRRLPARARRRRRRRHRRDLRKGRLFPGAVRRPLRASRSELRTFMTQILAAGGIGIDHATVTDDGTTCAIEFNAVRFGKRALDAAGRPRRLRTRPDRPPPRRPHLRRRQRRGAGTAVSAARSPLPLGEG